MEEKKISYKIKAASEKDVFLHLRECNDSFLPPLNEKVNIDEYAKKIFEKAITFEAWENQTLVGLIAAYFNDLNKGAGFITNVSVLKNYMGQGIASELLKNCIQYARQKKITEMQLEVDKKNMTAILFYKKYNFMDAGINADTILMKLKINNK